MVLMTHTPSPEHTQDNINDEDEISLLDFLEVISENLRLLVIGPIVAGLIGLGVASWMTPIFTAKTTIIPPGQNTPGAAAALLGQLGGLGSLVGNASGGASTNQYIAYLESNTLSAHLIEQLKLIDHYGVKNQEEARQALRGSSRITVEKKSGLISIEVSDSDPQFSTKIANAYVEALSKMLGKMTLQDAKHRRELFEQQIDEAIIKSYRSPFIRESIIQSIVREYETAILDQKKDRPYIQQVDVAEVPKFRSEPKRAQIAIIVALTTGIFLILFVFVRKAIRNAKEDPKTKGHMQVILTRLRKQLPW
jgi:uncharacterized protein involved in exopolysaccharide biosynthesis